MSRQFVLLLLLSPLLATTSVSAHPYFPLREGMVLNYNYSFEVKTDRSEFKKGNAKGTITTRATNVENQGGHPVVRFVTAYQGIPFIKQDAVLWRREEGNALFVGQLNNRGEYFETMELPAELTVGTSWDYNDGVPSRRTISATRKFQISGEEILGDCIDVSRKIVAKEGDKKFANLKEVSDITTYCRNTGSVQSLFIQPSPIGDYRTETILSSRSQ